MLGCSSVHRGLMRSCGDQRRRHKSRNCTSPTSNVQWCRSSSSSPFSSLSSSSLSSLSSLQYHHRLCARADHQTQMSSNVEQLHTIIRWAIWSHFNAVGLETIGAPEWKYWTTSKLHKTVLRRSIIITYALDFHCNCLMFSITPSLLNLSIFTSLAKRITALP